MMKGKWNGSDGRCDKSHDRIAVPSVSLSSPPPSNLAMFPLNGNLQLALQTQFNNRTPDPHEINQNTTNEKAPHTDAYTLNETKHLNWWI